MKTRRNAPRAQSMKEHRFRIGRFVGMKFVEKLMARMAGIDQLREFGAQRLNLIVIQCAKAGEVAVSVKELDLLVCWPILFPIRGRFWCVEMIADGSVKTRQVT